MIMKKKKKEKPRQCQLKVTDAMFELITKDIASGFDVKDACRNQQVGHDAYYTYLKHFPNKAEVHRSALVEKENLAYRSISEGMTRDWKCAAWWLERTKPERFRERKEITTTTEKLVEIDIMGKNETGKNKIKRDSKPDAETAEVPRPD
jgi:hypothetical protein